jgi:hypothetical protein
VKLEPVIVPAAIARENRAVTAAERLTSVAPATGTVCVTAGGDPGSTTTASTK